MSCANCSKQSLSRVKLLWPPPKRLPSWRGVLGPHGGRPQQPQKPSLIPASGHIIICSGEGEMVAVTSGKKLEEVGKSGG